MDFKANHDFVISGGEGGGGMVMVNSYLCKVRHPELVGDQFRYG